MTNPDYTAIACLMDRSGSMGPIREDAEGAFNNYVDAQRALPGKCTLRLSQFDDKYETVYHSTPISLVEPYKLRPRGWTALLDGIGRLVTDFGTELRDLPEDARPAKVIVVVQTDGMENASKMWTRPQIRGLVSEQQEKYGWHFVFLGADQDAIFVGETMGFERGSSMAYANTARGTRFAGQALAAYTATVRSGPVGQSVEFTDDDRATAMLD